MKQKMDILRMIAAVLLFIPLMFRMGYIWVKLGQMFCGFEMDILVNVCEHLVDIVAIVALLIGGRKILNLYWLIRIMCRVYNVIEMPAYSSMETWFLLVVEVLLYGLGALFVTDGLPGLKALAKNTYYVPVVLLATVLLARIVEHNSGYSTIINYSITTGAHFCIAYWVCKCSKKRRVKVKVNCCKRYIASCRCGKSVVSDRSVS